MPGPVFGLVMETVVPKACDKFHDHVYDRVVPARFREKADRAIDRVNERESGRSRSKTLEHENENSRPRTLTREELGSGPRQSSRRPRQHSESPTRIRRLTDKHFDNTDKGIKAAGLGVIAGGVLGHAFGKTAGSAAIGAALGGLGANAFERHHARRAEGDRGYDRRSRRSESAYGRRGSQSSYDGRRGSDAFYDGRRGSEATYDGRRGSVDAYTGQRSGSVYGGRRSESTHGARRPENGYSMRDQNRHGRRESEIRDNRRNTMDYEHADYLQRSDGSAKDYYDLTWQPGQRPQEDAYTLSPSDGRHDRANLASSEDSYDPSARRRTGSIRSGRSGY